MAEYIEREALLEDFGEAPMVWTDSEEEIQARLDWHIYKGIVEAQPAADVVEVKHGYHEGDVCIYGFGHENKSRSIVEIVRILNDERGVAEIKFLKVYVDDTGNGFFNYLLKSGGTMNASFKYLKNITPRMDGE